MQVRKDENRREEEGHMKEAEDFFDFDGDNFDEPNKDPGNNNDKK